MLPEELQKEVYQSFLKILNNSIIIWKSENYLPRETFNNLAEVIKLLINADERIIELSNQRRMLNELLQFIEKNKNNISTLIIARLNTFKINIIREQKDAMISLVD
ncbi:hypothetical protein J4406_02285 [Candidatus Woesearchaeota archaeon]|nr:hypothetical protein [Candidatus Woesearchaeota archaeon]